MGGEITWQCQGGGQYILTLKVYRDCQGPALNTVGQFIRIWNHPTMTSIPISLISQNDISPLCTQVPGGPGPITCASPSQGAIQEYVFQSVPVFLGGTPPAQGWAFTYDSFSRNLAIDNLNNPGSYGITIRAIMYPFSGMGANPCYDSSPQFLEKPATTVCSGQSFLYNHNAYDPDGDSLVFSFGEPLDRINPTTPVFNPPTSPVVVPYQTGYSVNSPTPSASLAPGSVPASIDPQTGEVSLLSTITGNFVIVVKVTAYRCGTKIAEVYREMQLVVMNCGSNTAPVMTPPFAGGTSFDTTVTAGAFVNFIMNFSDAGVQPNGAAQVMTVTPTGDAFGASFTNPASGCSNPPCAVLNAGGPYTGSGSLPLSFSWQTDCAHLGGSNLCGATSNTHTFVFKVQDDYCPVPAVAYYTVSITVLPNPAASAVHIHCADVAVNGDVTLTWDQASDPGGNFQQYEVYDPGGFLLATIPSIATTSWTHIGVDAQLAPATYYIVTRSGCAGGSSVTTAAFSDTVTTMFINVNNPSNGTAVLQWNALHTPLLQGNYPWYYIYREYPLGTWTLMDSVPYGTQNYLDTIDICFDTLNYKIGVMDSSGCMSFSSIRGDYFQDMIEPFVPVITYITVDTTSNQAQIVWAPNQANDTQGYIILQNIGGSWIVIDTVYGIGNTSYTYSLSDAGNQSESYGVAAFDSCWWGNPPGPNTSGMGVPHTTMYLSGQLSVCDSSVIINWNAYDGWSGGVLNYQVYASENGGPMNLVATLSSATTSYTHAQLNRGSVYRYVIVSNENGGAGAMSISNVFQVFIYRPGLPSFGYLKTATVSGEGQVTIRYERDVTASVSGYRLQRSDDGGYTFTDRAFSGPSSAVISFVDDAETDLQSYDYRVLTLDSCGLVSHVSNIGRTIYLHALALSPDWVNKLNWNKYIDWNGNVMEYQVYRSVNGIYDPNPITVVTPLTSAYTDDVFDLIESTGEFCYYVEAVETGNPNGQDETSRSNENCVVQDPLAYIPNAFTPGGNNPVFLPVISYFDFNEYEMLIYDRWGEQIFSTRDHLTGWDGTYRNQLCKEGVYVYLVSFRTGAGRRVELKGFVTLLVPEKQ